MPQFRRTDRINEQLRQEISLLIRDGVRDPRVGLATVTAVEASPGLGHARIDETALGEEDEYGEVLAGHRRPAAVI
ncbi:MAG: ribosome-binding factor A, partial [Gemmatimonadota bacterium]